MSPTACSADVVLLTGMSGAGKSTAIAELIARTQLAIDLDCEKYSHWVDSAAFDSAAGSPVEPGRDWVWREDAVTALLDSAQSQTFFVAGCSPNMGLFRPRFRRIVLLTAPSATLVARLLARNSGYGPTEAERKRVVELQREVEPLLRRMCDVEIDTSGPLGRTIDRIQAIANS